MGKRLVTIVILLSFFLTPLLAQSPPGSRAMSAPPAAKQSRAASSPAPSLGMFAFLKNQQTISLMPSEAPRCAVVCGISCIRPRAPFNDTAFPVPYDGGLFECLRSGLVTPYPPGAPHATCVLHRPGCSPVDKDLRELLPRHRAKRKDYMTSAQCGSLARKSEMAKEFSQTRAPNQNRFLQCNHERPTLRTNPESADQSARDRDAWFDRQHD